MWYEATKEHFKTVTHSCNVLVSVRHENKKNKVLILVLTKKSWSWEFQDFSLDR